jgi:hypothetical protein
VPGGGDLSSDGNVKKAQIARKKRQRECRCRFSFCGPLQCALTTTIHGTDFEVEEFLFSSVQTGIFERL